MAVLGILSLVASFVLVLIFWINLPKEIWQYYRRCKLLKPIPSWPTHWLLGHLPLITLTEETMLNWHEFVRKTKCKLGVFWVGPFFASVGVQHPEPLRKLLKEEKSRSIYKMLIPWLGEGLLISEGKKWARSRRLLTPAFHFEILKGYIPVYNSCLRSMLGKWEASAHRNEPVKLFDTISLLSLDIILQCAFSYKSDCQNVKCKHPYVKAVYDLIQLSTDRFLNPVYHIDWIYALTPSGRKTRNACRIFHDLSMKVINERRQALGLDNSENEQNMGIDSLFEKVSKTRKYLDFLDILLTAKDDDGTGLSITDIRAEADTFMFEGHDTTTSGICWTLYCLSKYPEHQDKIREEVRNVLMGREQLEYDDLKDLKYTQWCIKEAMRLYPPVMEFYRKVSEDVTVGEYTIPKDTQLAIMVHSIHRNAEIWENPLVYDPLRFHPTNVEKRDPYAYIPFSAGHRNCIGQNFALNEEKIVVGTLINRFRLTLDEDHKVSMVLRVVMRTVNDIQVKLEPLDL